jgi:hypothetical protein
MNRTHKDLLNKMAKKFNRPKTRLMALTNHTRCLKILNSSYYLNRTSKIVSAKERAQPCYLTHRPSQSSLFKTRFRVMRILWNKSNKETVNCKKKLMLMNWMFNFKNTRKSRWKMDNLYYNSSSGRSSRSSNSSNQRSSLFALKREFLNRKSRCWVSLNRKLTR